MRKLSNLLFLLVFVVISNCFSQSITLTPVVARKTLSTQLNVSGNNVVFTYMTSTSPTSCPGTMALTADNVVLTNNTYDIKSVSQPNLLSSNSFTSSFYIPSGAPSGVYNLIVGSGTGCALQYTGSVTVTSAPTSTSFTTSSSGSPGQSIGANFIGSNIIFSNATLSDCPGAYSINSGSVGLIGNGKTIAGICSAQSPVFASTISTQITIPNTLTGGIYDVVIGLNTICPLISHNALTVSGATLNRSLNASIQRTKPNFLNISGNNVTFQLMTSTQTQNNSVCPGTIQLDINEIVLKQNNTEIPSSSISFNSSSSITNSFLIPLTSPLGVYDLIVGSSSGCALQCLGCVTVTSEPANTSFSISASGSPGQSTTFNFTGNNIVFTSSLATNCPGSYALNYTSVGVVGNGSTITGLISSNSSLYASTSSNSVDIPGNISGGIYDVVIGLNTNCPLSCKNCFTVTGPSLNKPAKDTIVKGNPTKLYISGKSVTFIYMTSTQSASSNCPGNIAIYYTDIVLRQGNVLIQALSQNYPYQSDQNFSYNFNIPLNSPVGFYDLIVGSSSGCALTCSACIVVTEPNNWIISAPLFQNLTTFFTSSGVNLIWSEVANATSYCIEIYTDQALTKLVSSTCGVSLNHYMFTDPNARIEAGINYYFRVQGENNLGKGPWSASQKFTINNTILSINKAEIETLIRVYPNPSRGSFVVDNGGVSIVYQILNTMGENLKSGMLQSGKNEINVQLTPGLYYFYVNQKGTKLFIE
jgi:hypothetical protein